MTAPPESAPLIGANPVPAGHANAVMDVVNRAKQVSLVEFTEEPHPVDRLDVDPMTLQEDLVRELGRDVAVTLRMPTDDEPGELRVLNPTTGAELPVDPNVIQMLIRRNGPPESNEARFLREYDGAAALEAKLDAVRDMVARAVAEQDYQAGRRRRASTKRSPDRTIVARKRNKPPLPANMVPRVTVTAL